MPNIKLDSKPAMYPKISRIADPAVKEAAEEIKVRADENLAVVRASSDTPRLDGAVALTEISVDTAPPDASRNKYGNDYLVVMSHPFGGAMAIEMGHDPSGKFSGTSTRAPRGLYILSRAAGLLGLPRFRKK